MFKPRTVNLGLNHILQIISPHDEVIANDKIDKTSKYDISISLRGAISPTGACLKRYGKGISSLRCLKLFVGSAQITGQQVSGVPSYSSSVLDIQ